MKKKLKLTDIMAIVIYTVTLASILAFLLQALANIFWLNL